MSGWLKSGMGGSSPLEGPRSPTASPAQALGGNKNTDTATKARRSAEKPRTSSKSKTTNDGTNRNETAARAAEGANPAMELATYREQLKKQMSAISSQETTKGSPKRPSPISEEESTSSSNTTYVSGPSTTSTNSSTATIRGLATPGVTARTPSYPFPRMHSTTGLASHLHRPFTTLSPTLPPDSNQISFQDVPSALDRIMSNPSTPASTLTFQPHGASQSVEEPSDFPNPNLYDLSLMLSAEPGLDAWWQTVIQIMTEVYKAERVTLAVPADTTDIENVPWGQKATFNARGEDDLSMGYMARGSSIVPSGADVRSDVTTQTDFQGLLSPSRPDLYSRHSFTSFETRQNPDGAGDMATASSGRPNSMPRSKSSYPITVAEVELEARESRPALSQKVLEEHDAAADDVEVPGWGPTLAPPTPIQPRVLPMLQALDIEADPLIDHNGIRRVLERGKVIALTRSYPYLDHHQAPPQAEETKGRTRSRSPEGHKKQPQPKRSRPESFSKLSSLLGGAQMYKGSKSGSRRKRQGVSISRLDDEDMPRPPTPKYEEYEQAPPSPWSQSPAPSPAIRSDPSENPFFTDAVVDEDSFNPASAPPPDYTILKQPETIGVDNSWTVLHIPMSHVLLSRPTATFKLDTSSLQKKSHMRNKSTAASGDPSTPISTSPGSGYKEKHSPIAVLSILSPIIPYPSNLRHSLAHLAPHLATSFSLCRHYTNLEVELAGLQKRNPDFIRYSSSLGTDGRLIADPIGLEDLGLTSGEVSGSQRSMGGSITSPSDYSVPSRSAAGSTAVTPSWDIGNLGFVTEKRQVAASPLVMSATGDSYFSAKPTTSAAARGPVTPGAVNLKERRNSRDSSGGERRFSKRNSGTKGQWLQDSATEDQNLSEDLISRRLTEDLHSAPEEINDKDGDSTEGQKPGIRAAHRHTQLHSYGADFSHTFQSLPPSSTVGIKNQQTPSRGGSGSVPREMLPPSDTLKGLILDSLPAHVFVAQPPAGDMLWVNSRYLVYRGVTPAELAADPYGSLHPDDREEYINAWTYSLRTGEPFSRTVRIKRFDNAYRWFQARAIATRDKRNTVQQFLGSYMDIHDQHTAELKAARQEEIEASEAKHRLLANLIPQIIFTATEDEGITFANEQWLSYTGQSFEDSLGLGFMDHVHPDDLAKCRIPTDFPTSHAATPMPVESAALKTTQPGTPGLGHMNTATGPANRPVPNPGSSKLREVLSRYDSSSSTSSSETSAGDLLRLAKKGVIKAGTDSSGRVSYTTEVRLRSKTAEYRWHLIRCVEIGGVNWGSGVSSYFGSATDINDHKLLETKLKEAMESKGRFLSNMSHEIRTPLIGISGMVSFLQETTLTEEQRDYTNTIHTSASSLIMIINDILDLSKVDAGMMKLKYEWFHTTSLIEAVNELVSTMAIAKGLELNYIVEPDVPTWVKGDKVRIRQVLLNVIGNAIKFTSEGEVFSRCSVATIKSNEIGENEIMLEFSIIDTGRGFTKDESDIIFKPFSQIDGSSTRQHGGSGLGLVISRQLVELHGGEMNGTAIPGKGSNFTFTAKFGLPTDGDSPDSLGPTSVELATSSSIPEGLQSARLFRNSSLPTTNSPSVISPASTDPSIRSPATGSSASSDPSIRSNKTHDTARTSISSLNAGLVNFSEAARASGQDLSQMKLEMPDLSTESSSSNNSNSTLTPDLGGPRQQRTDGQRPAMYSILIISPQTHSREATTKHIEMTLPKEVPHKVTPLATVAEARRLLREADSVTFTHVVVNLPSTNELIGLMGELVRSKFHSETTVLILSDSVQRQAIVKQVAGTEFEPLLSDSKVTYIYKPVKPSRFAVIFDPSQERDISIDRNRSTAEKIVETQKQSYVEIEKRMGNRGLRVLLVEDNPINQKVLIKYLKKVGVMVEVARDGEECTEIVFGHERGYFALILCDLHMPKKDGYAACREVREWEQHAPDSSKVPIIALSANVMADVQEKCLQAGFDAYVTKPVDFVDLSNTLAQFF